ncbi:MAG: prephenate dehydrogenase/arogenate dehydrogenase family protein [Candidatus Brocadiia bacterium]
MFQRAAIVGPGLIGGSMGMALRRKKLADVVVGIGRRKESLRRAMDVGAIDRSTLDLEEGVREADFVVLATPTASFEEIIHAATPHLRPEALLTDVASTKVRVIETVSAALRERPDVAYIPTHPMAGSEQSGPLAARADLFEGAVCIITPLTNTYPETKRTIRRMWEALGATTVSMSPQAHDRLVARISHVPHLAAAALMGMLDDHEAGLAGGGLRDTTRIASGSPELWIDICRSNREQVRRALDSYVEVLQQMSEALRDGNLGELRDMLEEAKRRRDSSLHETE